MKRKLFLVSIALVMILSIFAAACNGKNQADSGNAAMGKPVDGGKVTLAMFSAFTNKFNPILEGDLYTKYIINYTFDSLWAYDDQLQMTKKDLADSWEFSSDKKTLTIKLKKDIKWHDGQPITADDLIFTWETMAHPDYTGDYFSQVSFIKGAQEKHDKKADKISGLTKVDDQTVKVELTAPKANALDQLWPTPIPKHVLENVPVKDLATADATTKADKIVGSGPFKFKEIKENEFVVLDKNKDYYVKGKPHLDQVIWKVVSQDVAVGALKKGEVDFLSQLSPKSFDPLNQDKNLTVKETGDFGYQYLGFNNTLPKLQNKKLRQAIAYAINRKGLVDGLLKGHGYVLNQHIVKASWAYNQDLENAYPYDVEKAKSLLAEAGYKDINGDGFVEDPQGKPFTLALDYPTGNPVREKSAPIIVENLKKAGINVTLNKPRDANAHYDAVRNGKSEMFLAGWSLTPDPEPAGIWLSTDQFNYIKYKNPDSDKLIKDATQTTDAFDLAKRKEMYKKWTTMISDEVPQVFLYGQNRIEAWNNRVHGVTWGWDGAIEQPDAILDWWVSK